MKKVAFFLMIVTVFSCGKETEFDNAYKKGGVSDTTGNNNSGTTWTPSPTPMTFVGSSYVGLSVNNKSIYSYTFRVAKSNSLVNPASGTLYIARTVNGLVYYNNQAGQAEFKIHLSGDHVIVEIISEDGHVNWNISVNQPPKERWFLAFGPACKYTQETGLPNNSDDGHRNYYSFDLIGGNAVW